MFLSILLKHILEELVHTLRLFQLENLLSLLFLRWLLFFLLIFIAGNNCETLVNRSDFQILNSFDMLGRVRIGNTVEMLNWGEILHQVFLLLLLENLSFSMCLHITLHPTLDAEMSALCIYKLLLILIVIIHPR